ncbi:hypothetical protein ACFVWY_09640 [Streptomyces sp. NPDC058195]|uniref:hypothetical protein n=1 Tax=Streptomyces sp. NPDC058195 TaxID=3346375 RepID=UPI0036F0D137
MIRDLDDCEFLESDLQGLSGKSGYTDRRMLSRDGRPPPLGDAIAHYGRISIGALVHQQGLALSVLHHRFDRTDLHGQPLGQHLLTRDGRRPEPQGLTDLLRWYSAVRPASVCTRRRRQAAKRLCLRCQRPGR